MKSKCFKVEITRVCPVRSARSVVEGVEEYEIFGDLPSANIETIFWKNAFRASENFNTFETEKGTLNEIKIKLLFY